MKNKIILIIFFLLLTQFVNSQFLKKREVAVSVRIPAIESYNDGEPWNIVNHYTWLPHFFKTLYFQNPNGNFERTFDNILKDKITLYTYNEYVITDNITDRWYKDIDFGCGFLYQIDEMKVTLEYNTDSIKMIGKPLSNFIMVHDMVVHEGDTVHWFDKAFLIGAFTKPVTHWIWYSNGVRCNYIYIPLYRNEQSTWILKLITFDGRELSIDLSNKYGELFQVFINETTFNLQ